MFGCSLFHVLSLSVKCVTFIIIIIINNIIIIVCAYG